MTKTLVAFYSRRDENYLHGQLQYLEIGNTEIAAEMIEKLTGADVFKIEQKIPYAKSYKDCIEEAKLDKENNARPKIKNILESIDQYDEIYLGYPNYWGTMPMAVFTFLESFDFSNKVIKPFCTHEGSGLGNSVKDIKKVCPLANVKDGLAIFGGEVNDSQNVIKNWID